MTNVIPILKICSYPSLLLHISKCRWKLKYSIQCIWSMSQKERTIVYSMCVKFIPSLQWKKNNSYIHRKLQNGKWACLCYYEVVCLFTHTSSKLAPLSMSKAASSTCPPQAARVRGDSKESAGMLTCAPLSNSSRATSTWPSWDSETHRECRDKHLNKYVGSRVWETCV